MYMLIAFGPNEIEVPCRFSEDKQNFIDLLSKLFPNSKFEDNILYISDEDYPDEDIENNPFAELFTSYYDGCGEVYKFEIQEIKLDQKFLSWSLD